MSIPTVQKIERVRMERGGDVEVRRAGRTKVRQLMEAVGGDPNTISAAMRFNEIVVGWGVIAGSVVDEFGETKSVSLEVRQDVTALGRIASPAVYDAMSSNDIKAVVAFVLGGTLSEDQVGKSEPQPA